MSLKQDVGCFFVVLCTLGLACLWLLMAVGSVLALIPEFSVWWAVWNIIFWYTSLACLRTAGVHWATQEGKREEKQ